jgi:dihydrofolate synthase/folylpolyglutamate synthase
MKSITSLEEAEAALEPFWPTHIPRHAYTLEHIEQFMEYIGNPQNLPRSIHIAGTSGKTSTAYYAAALLTQAGKKVGLLTSPHIEALNERVQVGLKPLAEKEFCAELTIFMELVAESGIVLTYAEILYGFAYWEFARHHVDYIVVEVGLGGLLDATNVIDRADKVCVITDIGLDHTHVLGNTLPEIAAHKSGIIHLHNPVFCHPQATEIIEVIQGASKQKQADLHIDEQTPGFLPIFQQRNFSLALAAVAFALERENGFVLTTVQMLQAAHVHIPARMEVFERSGKTVVLDNAHNGQKLHALSVSLRAQYEGQGVAMLVAFVETEGRSLSEMLRELKPVADHLIITALPPGFRQHIGRPPEEVAVLAKKLGFDSFEIEKDHHAAYQKLLSRPEPVLVITGSTYLLGPIRPLVVQS